MVQRTRTRVSTRIGGATWHPSDPSGTLTHTVYTDLDHSTVDYWKKLKRPDGSFPTSNFDSEVIKRRPPQISRNTGNPSLWVFQGREIYESYSPDRYLYPLRGSSERTTANANYALTLVSSTHPLAPVYSVPVAIKELAELAGMFQLVCKSFIGYVGGSYLNYRFGWVQFHRDVKTLLSITKEIESRAKLFNRLLEHGSTRTTRKLDKWEVIHDYHNSTFHSAYGVTIKGSLKVIKTMETWGSLHWGLNGDLGIPTDELERFNYAARVVFDLNEIDPTTLWELIPFSWLVDYFIRVGDLLQSKEMRYLLSPYDICIMRHYKQHVLTTVTQKPVGVIVDREGDYLREIKSRDTVSAPSTAPLSFDLLTADRWKVVLALLGKFLGK